MQQPGVQAWDCERAISVQPLEEVGRLPNVLSAQAGGRGEWDKAQGTRRGGQAPNTEQREENDGRLAREQEGTFNPLARGRGS